MIHVFGHPRSGNHYLSALLKKNRFGPMKGDDPNWRKEYGRTGSPHGWPPPFEGEILENLFEKDHRFFYIWRSYRGVGPSFLAKEKEAGRIRLDVTLPHLSCTPWEDLVKEGAVENKLLNRWVREDRRHMTPYECWKDHVSKWLNFAQHRTDVYAVRYEALLSDFQGTMSRMSEWVGLEKEVFENVTKKADPGSVREGGYREV